MVLTVAETMADFALETQWFSASGLVKKVESVAVISGLMVG